MAAAEGCCYGGALLWAWQLFGGEMREMWEAESRCAGVIGQDLMRPRTELQTSRPAEPNRLWLCAATLLSLSFIPFYLLTANFRSAQRRETERWSDWPTGAVVKMCQQSICRWFFFLNISEM